MIITIVQSEIENAIEAYLASKIKIADNQSFKIELLATRGSQGITANIEICDSSEPEKKQEHVQEKEEQELDNTSEPEKEKDKTKEKSYAELDTVTNTDNSVFGKQEDKEENKEDTNKEPEHKVTNPFNKISFL